MDKICDIFSVILVCKGGQRKNLSLEAANGSEVIKNLIKDFPGEEINFENIPDDILTKIIEYLEHHKSIPPKKIPMPLPKKDFKECVDQWDYEFINIELEKIFEIMMAANYMHIQSLLDLTSAKIADVIRGKSPEEINRMFKLDDENSESNDLNENIIRGKK